MLKRNLFYAIGTLFVTFAQIGCGNPTTSESGARTAQRPMPKVTAQSGVVNIKTEPGNAQIFINGVRKGNSPDDPEQSFVIKLGEGAYTIDALIPSKEREELHARLDDVFVTDNTQQSLTIELRTRLSDHFRAELRSKLGIRAIEPEMIVVSSGKLTPSADGTRTIDIPEFELGKYEVTFDEWDACVADGGCDYWPLDKGWGRGKRPVVGVSYDDVTQQYITWLNRRSGKHYRLPTEAEWEYAARGPEPTLSSPDACISSEHANLNGLLQADGCPPGPARGQTLPVGSLAANAFGLHDMYGNVWEWTDDCTNGKQNGIAYSPAALTNSECERRFVRGGDWKNSVMRSRDYRYAPHRYSRHANGDNLGFRLARSR